MKNKSACQSVSLTLFALLVFVLCRSVALAQETAWIKDKETLAPKGTLQLSGHLEMLPLATMTCNVTPASCDNVNVSGVAMLDGRLVVNMTGTFARSSRRTLLDAHGGRMGIFSLVKINYPRDQGLKARITYDANHMYLEVAFGLEGFPPPLATQTAHEIKPTPPAVPSTQAPGTPFRPALAGLTFAERVANQNTIEEVYWRHRIWPKDNPSPKPPLDAIVSQRQIEKKVEDYLRKSQLVADQRGLPISASELQAEMERIATHTKDPDMLRELFEALGNDPFVIVESLVKPILAERLASVFGVRTNGRDGSPSRPLSPTDDAARSAIAPDEFTYKLPEISPLDCTDDSWTPTNIVNAPEARTTRTAVWTGSEMIIWGGATLHGGLDSGGRYNPALDTWTATNTTNAPEARGSQRSVWTGSELIIWGGANSAAQLLNTGGRYNPLTDSWTPTNTINAPTARADHSAVWTGSEMIVWGGFGCGGNCNFNTGGRYNPSTDSWTTTSTVNAPVARWTHRAVWTGSEMIVWGGSDDMNYLHTGGRYDPSTDSWAPTGLANVPLGRIGNTALWSGSEMIIWGGVDETFNDSNTGGRYNPSMDSWVATNLSNAPSPRDSHAAVWTGAEMILWGGVFCCPVVDLNTGGRYSPDADSWMATSTANAPLARWDHTAVWTGAETIVWGGFNDSLHDHLNTGARYCVQSAPTSTPTPTPAASTTPTATPTTTPTATSSGTPAATPTATPTPTSTPRPSPTPRITPAPRARPTPPPRP